MAREKKTQRILSYLSVALRKYLVVFADLNILSHEVQAVLLVIVQLCQRNSGKMDEAGREVKCITKLHLVCD